MVERCGNNDKETWCICCSLRCDIACVRYILHTHGLRAHKRGHIFVSVIVAATTYSIVIHSLFDLLWNSSYALPAHNGSDAAFGVFFCVCLSRMAALSTDKTECSYSLCYFVFVVDLWFTMEHTTRVQLNIGLLFMMRRKAFPDTFTQQHKKCTHQAKKNERKKATTLHSFSLSLSIAMPLLSLALIEWIHVCAGCLLCMPTNCDQRWHHV